MALREQLLEYRCSDTLLEGFFCYDDEQPGPLPTVLISHAWGGREGFVEKRHTASLITVMRPSRSTCTARASAVRRRQSPRR